VTSEAQIVALNSGKSTSLEAMPTKNCTIRYVADVTKDQHRAGDLTRRQSCKKTGSRRAHHTHVVHVSMQIFPTKDFSTFPDALAEVANLEVFQGNLPRAAAFACAGPVSNNKCEMTNLSWVVDGDYLSKTHGIRFSPSPPEWSLNLSMLEGCCCLTKCLTNSHCKMRISLYY
jgi:hypothetical protein